MSTVILSLSFLIISISLIPNFGSFEKSFTPIILLFIAYLLLISRQTRFVQIDKSDLKNHYVISVLFLISYLIFSYTLSGWWVVNKEIISSLRNLSFALFPFLVLFVFMKGKRSIRVTFFFFFVAIAFFQRLAMLKASPWPPIDVFATLLEAPQKILSGVNPYNTMYTHVFPGITPDYFAYWPAAFILQIPFIKIFSDPRMLHILADIGAALVIFLIGGKTATSQLLSLTYLFRPHSLFIIEGSWLTPLNFFFTTLLIYLSQKISIRKSQIYTETSKETISETDRPEITSEEMKIRYLEEDRGSIDDVGVSEKLVSERFLSNNPQIKTNVIQSFIGISLGLLTSIQFFHVIIFFFLGKFLHWRRSFVLSFLATVSLFILPFLYLSPIKFFMQTVWVYFRNPPHPSILIHTSLNLNTLFFTYTGKDLPSFLSYLIIGTVFLISFFKQKEDLVSLVSNTALFFFTVFFFGRQAFVNYYYFVASLILLWLTLETSKN